MTTRWRIYALIYLPFLALAMLLAPLLPAFATYRPGRSRNGKATGVEPRLPDWLYWFMTPDNSLWGDDRWQSRHAGGYWSQVLWLWRNPAYGMAAGLLRREPPLRMVRSETHNGYRIDGNDGTWEHTRWYWGWLKVRTGWLLSGGLRGMFLLSVRIKRR